MEMMITVIQTVGFPIACVLCMGYFIYVMWDRQTKEWKQQAEALAAECQKREEKLYSQIDRFSETLNSISMTLIKIDTRLEVLERSELEKNS